MKSVSGKARYFLPSIGQYLFFTISLCLSFSPWAKGLLDDGDTGYHIRAGEYILDTLSIPHHDIFSYISPPLPWTAHEWLSEVIMALLHKVSGLTGVVIFFIFLISLTYTLLYKFMRINKGNVFVDLAIIILVMMSSQMHWLARPHMFSLLMTVLWYYVLDSFQNNRRNSLFLLPPFMLLWVNLHGGFASGFVLLGIYVAGNVLIYVLQDDYRVQSEKKIKQLGGIFFACLIAALINPYGFQIFIFPVKLVFNKTIMDNVMEFLSPNFHTYMPFKYLLLLLIGILSISRKKLNAIEVILVLAFTSMSLYSVRYILLFAIIVAPIMSRQAEGIIIDAEKGRLLNGIIKNSNKISSTEELSRGYLWPVTAVIIVVVAASTGKIAFRFDEKKEPVAAVDFLKMVRLEGNMYNHDEFGDYLIYAAYPEYRVFFDGRSDMYGAERLEEYKKVANFQAGWDKVIEKYEIRWIFFPSDSTLSNALNQREDWKLVYTDNVANIYLKNIPSNEKLIKKYGNSPPAF
jgi:hypothetical protein